uniref:Uncharacterized protein n=1 Tax=Arundo donax TaxID=35708 RepID=A0A0A8ZW68_ARUDO
MKVSPTGEW